MMKGLRDAFKRARLLAAVSFIAGRLTSVFPAPVPHLA